MPRSQATFLDTGIFLFDSALLPSSWRLSVQFGFLLLSQFGGSDLPRPRGPALEGKRDRGLCLRSECAGPFSLGLTESLEVEGWQEREFMERPRFLGD